MLKSMRSTATPEDESNAMDVYKGLLDTEYAKAMTGGGGLGIQDLVLNWMKESDPALRGLPVNGGLGTSTGANSSTNSVAPSRALQQLQLQQYQVQAMLPLLKE
jgi:Rod binding domain-containing protein